VSEDVFPSISTSFFGEGPPRLEDIRLARENGFSRFELTLHPDFLNVNDRQQVRQLIDLAESGQADFYSVHAAWSTRCDISGRSKRVRNTAVEQLRQLVALCARLRTRIIVLHPSWHPIRQWDVNGRIERAAASLRSVLELLGNSTTKLALEILAPPCLPSESSMMLELVGKIDDPENVAVCVDVNHVNLTEPPERAIGKLGNRVIHLHFSDNDGLAEKHWPPFAGVIDWGAVMRELAATKYQGAINFEVGWTSLGATRAEAARELAGIYQRLLSLARPLADK